MTDSVPRILVVDDTPANLKLLQTIFEFERFSVALVESGEAALAQAAVRLPDIVLLDLRMPGMDGIEVLGRLKAMAPNLPVIILTSHLEVAAAVEAIKLGANSKPRSRICATWSIIGATSRG
jgi:CheY-like chemotaxis protein